MHDTHNFQYPQMFCAETSALCFSLTCIKVLFFPHLVASSLTFSMLTVPVGTTVIIFEPYKWLHLGL
jgi:hypothetical protein